MFPSEGDPLWGVKKIADHLDVDSDWVLGFARDQGLDLFDIGGGYLRARQSDVTRFALRNSRAPLSQPDFQRQEHTDDNSAGAVPPGQKPPADPLRGYRPCVSERGRDFDLFPIGALAAALGRKPDTIRQWEEDGILPPNQDRTVSHDARGTRRLYARALILAITRIAEEEGVHKPHARRLRATRFPERVGALFAEDSPGSDA
ncbi:MerR family transcriptional regulator [Nonomuraea sp. NPDC052129]|uniref:MerR family transcriptional regulator n=1 Tax=Nonomuraea sp. NPDC052129 TaxID=3154651 RepID=UPI00344220F2